MPNTLKQRLDYDDLAATPNDGKRYELIDGILLVTPSPIPLHQRVSRGLERQLEAFFEPLGCEVFHAPVDLILTKHDVVVPDVLVVEDAASVTERAIEAPPLLVVEILSPGTRKTDRTIKFQLYARRGIRHYWIVDAKARRIECFRATGGSYELVADATGETPLRHPAWPGLQIDLAALWAGGPRRG